MKIAVILKGIAKQDNFLHFSKSRMNIDWNTCKDNIKATLIDDALSRGYSVDVFLATYEGTYTQDLVDYYKPKSHVFCEMAPETNQLSHLVNVLDPSFANYDFVVVSRFDIQFKVNVYDIAKIDTLDKVLFPWREEKNLVGDCLFIIPGKYVEDVIKVVTDYYKNKHCSFHYLGQGLGDDKLSFMFDGLYDSNSDKCPNPLYSLIRTYTRPIDRFLPYTWRNKAYS